MTTRSIAELEKLFVNLSAKVADGGLHGDTDTESKLYDDFARTLTELIDNNQSEVIQRVLAKVRDHNGLIEVTTLMDFITTQGSAIADSGETLAIRLFSIPVVLETNGKGVNVEDTSLILEAFYNSGVLNPKDELILSGALISIEDMPNDYVKRRHVMSEMIRKNNPDFSEKQLCELPKPSTADFGGTTKESELRFILGLIITPDLGTIDKNFECANGDLLFHIELATEEVVAGCDVDDSVVTPICCVETLDYRTSLQTGFIAQARDKLAVAFDKVADEIKDGVDLTTIEIVHNAKLNPDTQAYEFDFTFVHGVKVLSNKSISIPQDFISNELELYTEVFSSLANYTEVHGFKIVTQHS